jgi:hypothetical protein
MSFPYSLVAYVFPIHSSPVDEYTSLLLEFVLLLEYFLLLECVSSLFTPSAGLYIRVFYPPYTRLPSLYAFALHIHVCPSIYAFTLHIYAFALHIPVKHPYTRLPSIHRHTPVYPPYTRLPSIYAFDLYIRSTAGRRFLSTPSASITALLRPTSRRFHAPLLP